MDAAVPMTAAAATGAITFKIVFFMCIFGKRIEEIFIDGRGKVGNTFSWSWSSWMGTSLEKGRSLSFEEHLNRKNDDKKKMAHKEPTHYMGPKEGAMSRQRLRLSVPM